jgi:hypothetical protein
MRATSHKHKSTTTRGNQENLKVRRAIGSREHFVNRMYMPEMNPTDDAKAFFLLKKAVAILRGFKKINAV